MCDPGRARALRATADASPRPDPGAAPVDLVFLSRQTFGDPRLEMELLRLFSTQARQVQAGLGRPGQGAGASDLAIVHAIVGSARVVGADRVATLATRIESDLRRVAGTGPARIAEPDRVALHDALDEACRFVDRLGAPSEALRR